MANELLKQNYQAIADAIRSKTGSESTITPNDMPQAIEDMTTINDMTEVGFQADAYYKSSSGCSLYFPSGQSHDMEKVDGTLFERTQTIYSDYFYKSKVENDVDIGYNGSNSLERLDGTVFAYTVSLAQDELYRCTTTGKFGVPDDPTNIEFDNPLILPAEVGKETTYTPNDGSERVFTITRTA